MQKAIMSSVENLYFRKITDEYLKADKKQKNHRSRFFSSALSSSEPFFSNKENFKSNENLVEKYEEK